MKRKGGSENEKAKPKPKEEWGEKTQMVRLPKWGNSQRGEGSQSERK